MTPLLSSLHHRRTPSLAIPPSQGRTGPREFQGARARASNDFALLAGLVEVFYCKDDVCLFLLKWLFVVLKYIQSADGVPLRWLAGIFEPIASDSSANAIFESLFPDSSAKLSRVNGPVSPLSSVFRSF